MAVLGVVQSFEIGKSYRQPEKNAVILSVVIDDPQDRQTVEWQSTQGDTSVPRVGDPVLIHSVSPEFRIATAVNCGVIVTTLKEGERAVYSVSNNNVSALVEWLQNGEIRLNSGTDYAVKYNELKNEFNEFQGKYNKLVGILDAWTPVAQDGGAALKTLLEAGAPLDSSADISTCKVDKVRV
jgi:hypothetical protein